MNTTKLQQVLLASAILAGSTSAFAQSNISYNYAGVQYFDENLDDGDCSQDGIALSGSIDINNDFFALGKLADASGNKGCGAETISVGVGYHTLFGADSSIYGAVSFEDVSPDHWADDNGIIVAAGLRGFLNPNLEGKIEVAHHTVFDGNTVLNGGVAYWFNQQFAVTGDASLGSDISGAAIGLRMNF